MPELIEAPPAHYQKLPAVLKPFTWTREEAVQAAQRSAAIRSQRATEKKLADNAQPVDLSAQLAVNGQLRLVAEQIKRTRDFLNEDCIEPHHRAQLLRSFTTLLEQQRKLLGIGDPAPVKRSDRGSARAMIELRPLLADEPAQVQVVAPAMPLGWEYEDPPGMMIVAVREPAIEPADTTTGSVQPAT